MEHEDEMIEDKSIESILPDTDISVEEIKQELTDGEEDKQQATCSSLQSTHTTTHTPTTAHQDKRHHTCTLCSKSFARHLNLRLHISTVHEGERSHICKLCGKIFSFFLGNSSPVYNENKVNYFYFL